MKVATVLLSLLSLFSNPAFSAQPSCHDKVMTAARFMWSVNSNIEMKYLKAEVLNTQSRQAGVFNYNVIVNTPKFPQVQQRVPYNVLTLNNDSSGTCLVKQVTALP